MWPLLSQSLPEFTCHCVALDSSIDGLLSGNEDLRLDIAVTGLHPSLSRALATHPDHTLHHDHMYFNAKTMLPLSKASTLLQRFDKVCEYHRLHEVLGAQIV